ncbi:MAG TPA: P-loop NTPase fold protein, partial [bacterium]|nr:P-loop NTPase fold protein [bacterium]
MLNEDRLQFFLNNIINSSSNDFSGNINQLFTYLEQNCTDNLTYEKYEKQRSKWNNWPEPARGSFGVSNWRMPDDSDDAKSLSYHAYKRAGEERDDGMGLSNILFSKQYMSNNIIEFNRSFSTHFSEVLNDIYNDSSNISEAALKQKNEINTQRDKSKTSEMKAGIVNVYLNLADDMRDGIIVDAVKQGLQVANNRFKGYCNFILKQTLPRSTYIADMNSVSLKSEYGINFLIIDISGDLGTELLWNDDISHDVNNKRLISFTHERESVSVFPVIMLYRTSRPNSTHYSPNSVLQGSLGVEVASFTLTKDIKKQLITCLNLIYQDLQARGLLVKLYDATQEYVDGNSQEKTNKDTVTSIVNNTNDDNKYVDDKTKVEQDITEQENDEEKETGQDKDDQTEKHVSQYCDDDVRWQSDAPALKDALDRKVFAKVISNRIRDIYNNISGRYRYKVKNFKRRNNRTDRNEKQLEARSFVINLFAPWGAGKSSLLNLIKKELSRNINDSAKKATKWIVVDFNAWQHQHIGPPWWSLMNAVSIHGKEQLSFKEKCSYSIKYMDYTYNNTIKLIILLALIAENIYLNRNWIVSVGSAHSQYLLAILGVLISAFVLWKPIIEVICELYKYSSANAAKRNIANAQDSMRPIARRFERIVESLCRPVAVFIDDLDRCDGEYVVSLLEGIQTIFKSSPVVYIVAADHCWLCASYRNKYAEYAEYVDEPGKPLEHLFIEKIFQMTIAMPEIREDVGRNYWEGLLDGVEDVERSNSQYKFKIEKITKEENAKFEMMKTPSEILSSADEREDD